MQTRFDPSLGAAVRRFELHYLTRTQSEPQLIALKSLEKKCQFLAAQPAPAPWKAAVTSLKTKFWNCASALMRLRANG
jgi:hypothetical protein